MDLRAWSLRTIPVLLTVTLALPFVLPHDLYPVGVTLIGAFAATVLALIAAVRDGGRGLSRGAVVSLVAVTALAGWLTSTALFSTDPRISVLGMVSQHSGAALWVVATAWLLGAALLAERRTLRQLTAVVAAVGGAAGVLGVAEALAPGSRAWGSAAGPFENSSSLGSFLAVATFAALAWALSSRTRAERAAAFASLAASVAGIAAGDSRTGMAALVVGVLVCAALYRGAASHRRSHALAIALPLAGVIATMALVAAATGAFGEGALEAVRTLGTERDTIWRSAAAQVAQAPLAGSGPEQFSAWIAWEFDGGDLSFNGTYDPHNAILGLALGGGVVAIVLWLVFSTAVLATLLRVFERAGRPRALAALIGVPAALTGAMLFTWLTPAAVIAAAAITGALLAADEPHFTERPGAGVPATTPFRALAGLFAVACVAIAALALPAFSAERAFVRGEARDAAGYAELYHRWPEPAYASLSVNALLREGAPASAATSLVGDTSGQATYHVDLALREIFMAQRAVQADPAEWPRFVKAVERGATADPASGIWYTLAAVQADLLGRADDSRAWATLALGFPLSEPDRAYLEMLAAK